MKKNNTSNHYFDEYTPVGKTALVVIKAIKAGKFRWNRYCSQKKYVGSLIQTQPVHASYGQIGYDVYIYDEKGSHKHTISYDWEMNEIRVDDEFSLEEIENFDNRHDFYAEMKHLMKKYQIEFSFTPNKNETNDVYVTVADVTELLISETDTIKAEDFDQP